MNRHKAYWSTMGNEPSERALTEKELKKRLEYLVSIWGIGKVINNIRIIAEEQKHE